MILRQKIIFLPIAEGGAKIFGVFRVKNHDFTPKNHIFTNCGGRRENFWGISCEKSRFYAKKIIFLPILGGRAPGARPESAPGLHLFQIQYLQRKYWVSKGHNQIWVCLIRNHLSFCCSFQSMNL
jgi:hypothetical protein